MYSFVALVVALNIVLSTAKVADPQKLRDNYKQFLTENGKDLSRLGNKNRLQKFQDNMKYIFEHNADPTTTYLLTPNKWTDSFDKELKLSRVGGWRRFNDDDEFDDDEFDDDESDGDDDDGPYYATDGKGMKASKAAKASKVTKATRKTESNLLVGYSYYYASHYDDAGDDVGDDDASYYGEYAVEGKSGANKLVGDYYYYADDDDSGGDDYYSVDDDAEYEGNPAQRADSHTLNWASRNNPLGFRVTPSVQHQQMRNIAGAVAGVAAITASVNINAKSRVLEGLSPMKIVKGAKSPKLAESTFGYVARNEGINTGTRSGLFNKGEIATIAGFEKVETNSEAALMEKLLKGPVAVNICAGSKDFRYYKTGIINGACMGEDGEVGKYTDHTVLLTGFGTDKNNNDYWLIQNSWGKNWGEGGFARIARGDGKTASAGALNIATRASYPVDGMLYTSSFSFWYENVGVFVALGLLGVGAFSMYTMTQLQIAKNNAQKNKVDFRAPTLTLGTSYGGYETVPDADEEVSAIQLSTIRPQAMSYQEV